MAKLLKEKNPEYFDILSTTNVKFEYKDDDVSFVNYRPHIELKEDELYSFAYSAKSGGYAKF